MKYFKWFIKEGYKSYIVPFTIGIFLVIMVIRHFQEMSDTPIGIQVGMYLTILLLFFAGFCKAVTDSLQFNFHDSIFCSLKQKFWNPDISWYNKYYDYVLLIRKKWFNLIPVPVLFTDGWHLFQSLFLTSIFVSICFYSSYSNNVLYDFILLRLVFGISFFIFYNYLLKKNFYGT